MRNWQRLRIFVLVTGILCLCQISYASGLSNKKPLQLRDEGTSQGDVKAIDCVGSAVACTAASGVGTLTISGSGESNTSSNTGAGNQLAKAKAGVDLPFRTLTSGDNVTMVTNTNDVTISVVSIPSNDVTGILALDNGGTGGSSASTARTSLGLGSIATQDSNNVSITGGSVTGITDLVVADGGTGVSTITDGGVIIGKGTSAIENTGLLGKGTLIVGDGVTNPTTLVVGTNGFVLSADSSTASGLAWVALPASAGGSPGGSAGQIQFNSASSFGGAALISTDTVGLRLAIGPGTSPTISLDVAGSFRTVPFALTDGTTIALDASKSNVFTVTLTGQPRTLSNITNGTRGQKILLIISQDSTGSRKMGFGTNYAFGSTITSFDASTTAGLHDYIGFVIREVSADIVAVSQGYR